jgi:hypothetical protein
MPVAEVKSNVEVKSTPLFVNTKQAQALTGIKIMFWGDFGTGKTFDACTFPGPIHILSTEYGVAPVANQTGRDDINRMECTDPFTEKPVMANGEVDDTPAATDPVDSLNKIEEGTEWLYQQYKSGALVGGTVVVDSVSDIWAWLGNWLDYIAKKSQSKSGKEYMMRTEWQKANARYKWIIMRLLALPCNLVLTARSSAVYDSTGNITTVQKPKAQGETAYYMDIVAHLTKDIVSKANEKGVVTGSETVRKCTIEKCRLGDVPGNLELPDGTYNSLKEGLSEYVPTGTFQ